MIEKGSFVKAITFLLILGAATGFPVTGLGQEKSAGSIDSGLITNPDVPQVAGITEFKIPPLGKLITAAQTNSPLLKQQSALIFMRDWQKKSAKHDWGRYLLFFTEVRYGSIDIMIAGIDNANSMRYNVGTRLQMSIFDALDLKPKNGVAESQYKYEEYKLEDLKRMIKDDVIRLWNKLVSYKEIVAISEDEVAVQQGNCFYAEQQFKAGDIPLLEFARIKEISIKADQGYQLNIKEFRETYLLLESLIGMTFEELNKNPL